MVAVPPPPRDATQGPSRLEAALREAVTGGPRGAAAPPPRLEQALLHAVFPGGARVRPRLVLATARAAGGQADALALAAAVAVELLHCASLAHDDLPCFDDADLRRGLPSVHKAFGEATAVLVGDGLIVLAFEALARALEARPDVGPRPLALLAAAAGPRGGLVAGQAWELEGRDVDLAAYHLAKTAALFEASAALGAAVAGADPAPFARLGRAIGMTYQLADDVADRVASVGELGKRPGRDAALGRPTAAADLDVARSRLRLAMMRTALAVPTCPGECELRAMVLGVLDRLAACCGVEPHDPLELRGRALSADHAAAE
ncbi:MAG TPA: polyprenyl synthetase family protein [Polyangiaceae bacterium]|nr:polyprenyl synthetase family protein [Polyangiaceae bacterium]